LSTLNAGVAADVRTMYARSVVPHVATEKPPPLDAIIGGQRLCKGRESFERDSALYSLKSGFRKTYSRQKFEPKRIERVYSLGVL
jgi:hypothetical protein